MCGIFGIVTKETQVLGPRLIEAGHKLSYRGYDTVGAATIPRHREIDLRKDAGRVDDVAAKYNFAEMHLLPETNLLIIFNKTLLFLLK